MQPLIIDIMVLSLSSGVVLPWYFKGDIHLNKNDYGFEPFAI